MMQGESFSIAFRPEAIRFANIYRPTQSPGYPPRERFEFVLYVTDLTRQFGVSAGYKALDPYVYGAKDGSFELRLRSYKRPPVYPNGEASGSDRLVRVIAALDAQNQGRDRVFQLCDSIEAIVTPWQTEGTWGPMTGRLLRGLSIERISVSLKPEIIL